MMTEQILDDLMIDPSLIVAWNTFRSTIHHVNELGLESSNSRVSIPGTLVEELLEPSSHLPWIYWYYGQCEHPTDPERARRDILRLIEPGRDDPTNRRTLESFRVSSEQRDKYSEYSRQSQQLLRRDGIYSSALQEILLEEWVFLNEHSWITARIRAAYDHMIEAGGKAIRFGERALEGAVRKTIRADDYHQLDLYDRTRAIGKWIAVGGTPAASLANPIFGAVVGTATGFFLLVDPE